MSDVPLIGSTSVKPASSESGQVDPTHEAFAVTHPWIQHYQHGVPVSITVPDHPLTWLLDCTFRRYPDYPAFIYYGNHISYAQFSHDADRFALALQSLGVHKGDRVAIALPNIPQYPIAFYGSLRAGAIVVPTNPLYTAREMQYQLADAGARVLVTLDTFYPLVRAIYPHTALEHVIVTSPADFLPPMLRVLYPIRQRLSRRPARQSGSGEESTPKHTALHDDQILHPSLSLPTHSMHSLLELYRDKAEQSDPSAWTVPLSPEDYAVLQYTGGTTGLSKGAILTHRALLANALQTQAWFPEIREGEERMLCVAPFFHAYGMTAGMNVSILLAAAMVLLPRFKAKDVLKAIRRYHPTLFPGIPTMYQAILHEASGHPDDLQSIKYCISGAAPLPAKVRADFEAITHGRLVEGYGLSEASPVTHCNPLTEQCRNGSIGLPLPSVDAAIVDPETSLPVPAGKIGEIMVKGPNIMLGYWHREEETRAIFRNGWMRTGDLGIMDKDGFFSVVERIKDVIIASGFKVYPREVEEVLLQHSIVMEVAVAGVPDVYRGETVAAFVVLKPDVEESEKTRQELVHHCEEALAAYKVPKLLVFRKSLPKTLIGKVLRRELQREIVNSN